MKVSEMVDILEAEVLCGQDRLHANIKHGFASDLMSDVLTLTTNDVALITGLVNLQAVRTAEMSDIPIVIFARNKAISADIVELGRDLGLIILRTKYSMFKSSGLLFENGLQPIF